MRSLRTDGGFLATVTHKELSGRRPKPRSRRPNHQTPPGTIDCYVRVELAAHVSISVRMYRVRAGPDFALAPPNVERQARTDRW